MQDEGTTRPRARRRMALGVLLALVLLGLLIAVPVGAIVGSTMDQVRALWP